MLSKTLLSNLRNFTKPSSYKNTVDINEIQHFKQFDQEWWSEIGFFKGLHGLNKLRVPLIRDGLINVKYKLQKNSNNPTPLQGISILDVGCGGGILTEPLARLGGIVTGLDPNADLIEKAESHAKTQNLQNIRYLCSSIEDHANDDNKYDAVVASEVIEHVSDYEIFLRACIDCLKPGGSIFLSTINKTYFANLAAIYLTEDILRQLPKGTHHYEKFVEPHKLQRILEEKCHTVLLHGMLYNFLTNQWTWSKSHYINYAMHAVKLHEQCNK